jgi:benzoate-CoA ligase family protein
MFELPERYNVTTLLDANLAAGRGAKIALICNDEEISYGELLSRVCRMGRAFRRLGVRPGDRVILILGDTPIFPVAFFGALRIGAVPCPINPLFREDDYALFVRDAGASVVVADATFAEKARRSLAGYAGNVTLIAPPGSPGAGLSLADLLSAEEDFLDPADTHRDDMAFWLYSGGSTGHPKAIVHAHQDIPFTCETYARHILEIGEEDLCFARVLFHAYGLGGGLTFPIWAGASSVLFPERPTAAGILAAIERFRPSLLFLVPALYNAILNEATSASADLSSLRHCISAAEPLAPEIWRRWRDRFGLEILDGLGSTEMLHIFCSSVPGAVRPGSSGRPVPGYELRLVDETGAVITKGDVGMLQVRGASAFTGYWRQRAKTRSTLVGEWVTTGDRYRVDQDGFYWYEGRSDDMIKVGGEWVSPIEIENVLHEHPAVREAAVVGVPIDGIMRIRAAVVLAPERTSSAGLTLELQEWCKGRLQRYQYPHVIDYVFELPKTVTGKVQRFRLREPELVTA